MSEPLVDSSTFAEFAEEHRRELRVHCYRLLGSAHDADDLVQETFLRAWRRRETYQGRSTFRAWLYKIATNACLDVLARKAPLPVAETPAAPVSVPWLTPCPAAMLDDLVVSRETIELAFLTAVQHLPARQRAALILRDVLGWRAKEVADLLDCSVAAANSALQRARETMRAQLPDRRSEWSASADTNELAVVRQYMAALESGDEHAIGALLAEDARCGQAPWAGGNMTDDPHWYSGRATLIAAWQPILHGPDRREFRSVLTTANHEPAIGTYIREPGSTGPYEAFGLTVVRVAGGRIAEISVFGADTFAMFDLPPTT